MRIKFLVFLYFIIFNQLVFSQNRETEFKTIFYSKIKKLPNSNLLKKTSDFYFSNELDSTLVYTQKLLNKKVNNTAYYNYSNFLRGLTLKEKKVFNESKNILSKIDKQFFFYPQVIASFGQIAIENEQYKESINYYKKIEFIINPKIYNIKSNHIKHNLGISYLLLKDFINAEKYLLENTKINENLKDTIALIGSYGDLANLYYEQFKDNQAIPYFIKAYELAKKTNDFKLKATTSKNMSIVEENRKNFEKANNYRKEYGNWKDSFNNQNKIWEVAQLEKQFAIKEKQKEVSVLKTENKLKIAERNTYLYSAIILLILFFVSFYFYMEKSKNNRIITKQKEKLNELNATKDKLFSIVSHDLRSSVNALKTSTTKIIANVNDSKWEEAAIDLKQNSAIANSTYNLLDNLLHWALLQNKQTYFEISPIKLYFIVEQVQFNYITLLNEKNISFENTVPKKATILADQESLKIIIRNLLDNAIKFSKINGYIKIYAIEDDKYWHFTIQDNGIGMTEDIKNQILNEDIQLAKKTNQQSIGSGLGMQLCKSMILKNNGKLNIESKLNSGTKMIISLPKQI